ncbi:hypothetical protein J3R74_004272 [Puniceicoccus vermicola]
MVYRIVGSVIGLTQPSPEATAGWLTDATARANVIR